MFEDYQAKVTQASQEVFELEQLALMKEHNELLRESQQEKAESRTERLNEMAKEKEAKKAVALALAKTRCKWINEDSENLSEKVNKVNIQDWKYESDLSISRAMVNIEEWEKDLEKIVLIKRDLDEILAMNNLADDLEILETKKLIDKLCYEVKMVVQSIKAENDSRELYTLDKANYEKVSLPSFEGRDDEDFLQFKAEIEWAFVHNRVSKSVKLKEVLTGFA